MGKPIVAAGFCLVVAVTSLTKAADNDLFSSVRTESVFTPSAKTPATTAPSRRSNSPPELEIKISSTGELARKLRQAGFEVEEKSENRMVSTKITSGQWTFPVLIVISEDGNELMMALLLSSVGKEKEISKSQLLKLLQANREFTPSSFGYSAKRKRTELYHTLKNQRISGKNLRDEINRLAEIAAKTDDLWKFGAVPAATTSSETPENPPATPSLTGKWVATRSATEAFAVQFNADGTFLLVYVNKGKQTRTSGKFTRAGQQLTFAGSDKFRLAGTLSDQSDKEFQFRPSNSATAATGLVFKRTK